MSSYRKDARWLLATTMVEKAGIEWTDLAYVERDHLLAAAERVLDYLTDSQVESLAIEFNSTAETALDNAPSTEAEQRRRIEIAIGYEPIHASWTDADGAHGVVTHMAAIDRDRIVDAVLPLVMGAES